MQTARKTILIISPEAWGLNFVSKHHYAQELAAQGHTVYFLNPPSNKNELQISPNGVQIINYKSMFRGLNRLPKWLKNWLTSWQIEGIKKLMGAKKISLVWSFDPFRFQQLKQWGAERCIYHPVDIHQTSLDLEAAASADLILATTDIILSKFKEINKPKYQINHGLAAHFLQIPNEKPQLVGRPDALRVAYVGNLQYQFLDTEAILAIINTHAEIDFYFIGPYQKNNLSNQPNPNDGFIAALQKLPNAHLLGSQPSKMLPAYLVQMDLFLMAYAADQHKDILANPHKVLEYLSTGKVIVTNYTDAYKDKIELLQMTKKQSELAALFQKTVENLDYYNREEIATLRKKYAAEQTYAQQIGRIEQLLTQI